MSDLIDRQAVIDELRRDIRLTFISSVVEMLVVRVKNLPAVQPEPIEQIKWERDTAIQQLADLGYGLGEKPRTYGDCISRQAAIDALDEMHCKSDEDGYVWIVRSDAWSRIDALPSAQPERKKGEWEEIEVIPEAYDIAGVKTWASKMRCNQCGFTTFAIEGRFAQYNFCPHCGCQI